MVENLSRLIGDPKLVCDTSISQADNQQFCEKTGNNQAIHLDEKAAQEKNFETFVINGLLISSLVKTGASQWLQTLVGEDFSIAEVSNKEEQQTQALYPEQRFTAFSRIKGVEQQDDQTLVTMEHTAWLEGEEVFLTVGEQVFSLKNNSKSE